MFKNTAIAVLVAALAASLAVTAIASNDLWHTHGGADGGPIWRSPPTSTPVATPTPEPEPVVRITRTAVHTCSTFWSAGVRYASMAAYFRFTVDESQVDPTFHIKGPSAEFTMTIRDQDGNVITTRTDPVAPNTLLTRWRDSQGLHYRYFAPQQSRNPEWRAQFALGPRVVSVTCHATARLR